MRIALLSIILLCAASAPGGILDQRPGEKWSINGAISQLVQGGALIHCHKTNEFGMRQPDSGAIVFVRGRFGTLVDDDKVKIVGVLSGEYKYGSVIGHQKTVRAFDLVSLIKIETEQ